LIYHNRQIKIWILKQDGGKIILMKFKKINNYRRKIGGYHGENKS